MIFYCFTVRFVLIVELPIMACPDRVLPSIYSHPVISQVFINITYKCEVMCLYGLAVCVLNECYVQHFTTHANMYCSKKECFSPCIYMYIYNYMYLEHTIT